jgi:hypothetical protein
MPFTVQIERQGGIAGILRKCLANSTLNAQPSFHSFWTE